MLSLTNAVIAVHGLKINLRVPIAVVEHNHVGYGKVEPIPPARVLGRK